MIFTYAQQTWYHATKRFYLLVLPALHWRGCSLSGPPLMAAGPFWHPINVRLTRTLWEAEKDNFICWCLALLFGTWKALFKCLWQYTWAVSKRRVFLLWALGRFLYWPQRRGIYHFPEQSEDFAQGALPLSGIFIPYIHAVCAIKQKRQHRIGTWSWGRGWFQASCPDIFFI